MNKENVIFKFNNLRHALLTKFAELFEYDWSDDFKLEELKSFPDPKLIERYQITKKDLEQLGKKDLFNVGFGLWSEESGIYLIPIHYKPFLDPEMEVISINDEIVKAKDMDNDHRGGMLAYGIKLN